jgi:hypothetical protein
VEFLEGRGIHNTLEPCIHGSLDPCIHGSLDRCNHGSLDRCIHGSLVSSDPLILVSRFWHKVPRTFFLLANWRNILHNFWTPTRHLAFADGSCLLSIGPQLGPSCCSRESNSCFFHAYKNNHNNHTSPTIIHGSLDPCIHGSLILVSTDPLILVSTDPLILVSRFWHKVPRTFFCLPIVGTFRTTS